MEGLPNFGSRRVGSTIPSLTLKIKAAPYKKAEKLHRMQAGKEKP
jgi:hypothetical protein